MDLDAEEARWKSEADRAHAAGDHAAEGHAHRMLATVCMIRRDVKGVREHGRVARTVYRLAGDRLNAAVADEETAAKLAACGIEASVVEPLARAALSAIDSLGGPGERAKARATLARIVDDSGRHEEAAALVREAIAIAEPGSADEARDRINLAAIHRAAGRREEACAELDRAVAISRERGREDLLVKALRIRMELATDDEMLDLLSETLEILPTIPAFRADPTRIAEAIDFATSIGNARGVPVAELLSSTFSDRAIEDFPPDVQRFAAAIRAVTTKN